MRPSKAFSLLLILIFCLPAWGNVPAVGSRFPTAHRAEHWIVTENDQFAAGCTAYAIGPHALMTAEHCDIKPGELNEDGDLVDDSPVLLFVDPVDTKPPYLRAHEPWRKIVAKEFDGSDHMILLVSGPAFKDILPYATEAPVQGEHVMWWGNPAGIRDQLREGYVMGSAPIPPPAQRQAQQLWLVDARAIGGDSGSAVIDADTGFIVGIVTFGVFDGQVMGMYALHFTAAQIAVAQSFQG